MNERGPYCIDTCSLVDLWRRVYPRDVFPGVWEAFEQLILDGRIIAPREVLKELEHVESKEDELLRWARQNGALFLEHTSEVLRSLAEVVNETGLLDSSKTTEDADPAVVALARVRRAVIVTEERPGGRGRPRIPDAAARYRIRCLRLLEMFREEGWAFRR